MTIVSDEEPRISRVKGRVRASRVKGRVRASRVKGVCVRAVLKGCADSVTMCRSKSHDDRMMMWL